CATRSVGLNAQPGVGWIHHLKLECRSGGADSDRGVGRRPVNAVDAAEHQRIALRYLCPGPDGRRVIYIGGPVRVVAEITIETSGQITPAGSGPDERIPIAGSVDLCRVVADYDIQAT